MENAQHLVTGGAGDPDCSGGVERDAVDLDADPLQRLGEAGGSGGRSEAGPDPAVGEPSVRGEGEAVSR
jgi:hypothetical protein